MERICHLNDVELMKAAAEKNFEKTKDLLEEMRLEISHPSCWLNRRKYYAYLTVYHYNYAYFQHMYLSPHPGQQTSTRL